MLGQAGFTASTAKSPHLQFRNGSHGTDHNHDLQRLPVHQVSWKTAGLPRMIHNALELRRVSQAQFLTCSIQSSPLLRLLAGGSTSLRSRRPKPYKGAAGIRNEVDAKTKRHWTSDMSDQGLLCRGGSNA